MSISFLHKGLQYLLVCGQKVVETPYKIRTLVIFSVISFFIHYFCEYICMDLNECMLTTNRHLHHKVNGSKRINTFVESC